MILDTWTRDRQYPDAERTGEFVGMKILHEAVQNEWPDIAQKFIEVIHHFDISDPIVQQTLFTCVQKRWIGCLESLLQRGVDPTQRYSDDSIPLLIACKLQDTEIMQLLLDAGAKDLEITILQAIFLGYQEGFNLLWKRMAHTADLVRATCCVAALSNRMEILKVILKAERPEMILHRFGRKVRTICYGWCKKLVFKKLLPRLDWCVCM
jgi:hypothetical protein